MKAIQESQIFLVNLAYCPVKNIYTDFVENFAKGINKGVIGKNN